MKITVELHGVTYTTDAPIDELLARYIKDAIVADRNPAELVFSAAASGVREWDKSGGVLAAVYATQDYQLLLTAVLNNECRISTRQLEKAEDDIAELGRITGECAAIEEFRRLLGEVTNKFSQ